MKVIDSRVKINKIDYDTNKDKIRFVPLKDIISIIEGRCNIFEENKQYDKLEALEIVLSEIKERYT